MRTRSLPVDKSETRMNPAPDLTAELEALHDDYVYRVNALIEAGRDDLVRALVDDYFEVATRLIRSRLAGTGS
jgi:hypothetical protein